MLELRLGPPALGHALNSEGGDKTELFLCVDYAITSKKGFDLIGGVLHLCLQQPIPWAIGDGLTKGRLKYLLSAAYKRCVMGGKGVHAIHSSGMVCQGPGGDVIHSGGPFEDGFYELGDPPPPSHRYISPAP